MIERAAEAATAILIEAERQGDFARQMDARCILNELGVKLEERRNGYVWRV